MRLLLQLSSGMTTMGRDLPTTPKSQTTAPSLELPLRPAAQLATVAENPAFCAENRAILLYLINNLSRETIGDQKHEHEACTHP